MTTTEDIIIKRKAINSSGQLGSFYDACRDRLLESCNINNRRQQYKSTVRPQCFVMNSRSDGIRNILRIIGIEDDLRVSLLLDLTKRIGVSAILNGSDRINERTRLFYYSWIDREEQVSDEVLKNVNFNKLLEKTNSATHIISGINFGIDVIVILQLPSETHAADQIDRTLKKISDSLSNGTEIDSILNPKEKELLVKDVKIAVYSNIPNLAGTNKLPALLHEINKIIKNPNQCLPITYSLRLLPSLYPSHVERNITYCVLPSQLNNNLEESVLRQRNIRDTLKSISHDDTRTLLSNYLEGRLYGIYKQFSSMKTTYDAELKKLSELVIDFRNGRVAVSVINNWLIKNEQVELQNDSIGLMLALNDLKEKLHLISDLRKSQIKYCNVVDHSVDKNDDERSLRVKLNVDDRFVQILCSNDTFNTNNYQRLNKRLSDLINERERKSDLQIIYADFSYSSYKLQDMIILSSNLRINNRPTSSPPVPPHRQTRNPLFSTVPIANSNRSPPTDDTINILLLGETGVGKSTFTNAFANYLAFNSLTQAQSNKPVVIIPVSFTMTVGNKFEEREVKYGEFSSTNNENFNNVGQSVTQHCKSYIFCLKENGRKLRIIDTPGFGDTRGLEQDSQNMDHILQYVNNLTHLNAICFLLKPNSSRLNMFFRTCLIQLFSFLAPTARDNVIFCFTNARSTFYTPGDTAPLLKTMLASASVDGISLKKDNTFCFDSESFRYLVALRNGIPFSEEDKHEYEKSWLTSVKESNRLIDLINTKLTVYHIERGWQSIRHAQFEISHMIRPILETIRNILRNIILCRTNASTMLIKLRPKAAFRPIAVCFSCKRHPIEINQFWIMPDSPHDFQPKCRTYSCSAIRHKLIDYELQYDVVSNSLSFQPNEMNKMLQRLYLACAEFSHFLIHGARFTKDDLFMLGLLQMMREEKDICHEKQSNQMNSQLINELEKARHEYEQRMHEITSNQHPKNLTTIYKQIKIVNTYPEIHEQMNVIKQGQKELLKQYEVII